MPDTVIIIGAGVSEGVCGAVDGEQIRTCLGA